MPRKLDFLQLHCKNYNLYNFLCVKSHKRRENLVGGVGSGFNINTPQDHEKWKEILVGSDNGENPREI